MNLSKEISLRPYQEEAVASVLESLAEGKNPVVSMATGSGKSLIIAALCRELAGRILVITHRKELLVQNSEELFRLNGGNDDADAGIYSAGLGRRETDNRVVFGGIQSVFSRMKELERAGRFETIIADEAHRCAPRDAGTTMYGQVFSHCPTAARIGLSATPYRLDGGPIWGEGRWFDALACDVSISALTPEYLAPLKGILTAHDIDLTGVRTQSGEFVMSDVSQAACGEGMVDAAVAELLRLAANRKKWLVFCADVAHTKAVCERIAEAGITAAYVVGGTPADERERLIREFKDGSIRCLLSCLVFTEGFNVPSVDCIVLLRPSQSKGLIVQMIGRGCRQAPEKRDCVIIDFGGNLDRHAPMDEALVEVSETPERQEQEKKRKAARKKREWSHDKKASTADPFGRAANRRMTQRVMDVSYQLQASKKYPGKKNIVCTYRLAGSQRWAKTWICLEYPDRWPRFFAQQTFERKGMVCPYNAEEGLKMLMRAPKPVSVVVDRSERYPRIVVEHYEDDYEAKGREIYPTQVQ